jgi:hypothetical protein
MIGKSISLVGQLPRNACGTRCAMLVIAFFIIANSSDMIHAVNNQRAVTRTTHSTHYTIAGSHRHLAL